MQNQAEIIMLFVAGCILAALMIGFVFAAIYIYQRRRKEYEASVAKMQDGFQQQINSMIIQTQDKVFDDISEYLHGDVKGRLNGISYSLKETIEFGEELHTELPNIMKAKKNLDNTIEDIRKLSHSLRSQRIKDIGLYEAISFDIEQLKQSRSDIHFEFKAEKEEVDLLSKEAGVFLFRIYQDSIGNILSHAKATHVNIELQYAKANRFAMQIVDDGVGFNVKDKKNKTSGKDGIGLSNMYTRASELGGELVIDSKKDKGTVVRVEVPVKVAA